MKVSELKEKLDIILKTYGDLDIKLNIGDWDEDGYEFNHEADLISTRILTITKDYGNGIVKKLILSSKTDIEIDEE